MQPTRTDNWPARPTPGEVWWVDHTFRDDTTFNLRAALDTWATRHAARAERVPLDLTTMSQSAPPGDCGRAKTWEKNSMETAINIAIWVGVLAFAILLISPPAHALPACDGNYASVTVNNVCSNQLLSPDIDYYPGPPAISSGYRVWIRDYSWSPVYRVFYTTDSHDPLIDFRMPFNKSQVMYDFDYNSTSDQCVIKSYVFNKNASNCTIYNPVQAAFIVNQSNYRRPPTSAGFYDQSTGDNLSTWEWFASDSTGRYTFSSTDRYPIWQDMTHPGSYYVYLTVNKGTSEESFADTTFTVLSENVTPVPTILPNITVNITPAPTVTIQTMATFANLTAYNTTDVRINIEGYFGNLTGPFLDWSDDMAQGITDMANALFYLPNYPVLAITNILTIITDIGQQTLAQMSTSVNLVLQLARIAANSIPSDWQLLMVYALTLETVFLVMRGET